MKFSNISKTKPGCHSEGNLPTLKVLCGKNLQCKEAYPSIDVLGCGLCRQVSFGMTYVEFNFIKFILSQYLTIKKYFFILKYRCPEIHMYI